MQRPKVDDDLTLMTDFGKTEAICVDVLDNPATEEGVLLKVMARGPFARSSSISTYMTIIDVCTARLVIRGLANLKTNGTTTKCSGLNLGGPRGYHGRIPFLIWNIARCSLSGKRERSSAVIMKSN